jgi:hypothetical protein
MNTTIITDSTNVILTASESTISTVQPVSEVLNIINKEVELTFTDVGVQGMKGARGESIQYTVETLSTSGEVDVSKYVTFIDVTSDSTFTLPSATSNVAATCNIKRIDYTNKRAVISTLPGQAIDGNLYIELVPFQSINIVSNGANWFII